MSVEKRCSTCESIRCQNNSEGTGRVGVFENGKVHGQNDFAHTIKQCLVRTGEVDETALIIASGYHIVIAAREAEKKQQQAT